MGKSVNIDERVLSLIEASTGERPAADQIVVFEATVASTRPIIKRGSIFNGAVMSREMLVEMSSKLNSGSESVPLHTLHRQDDELPVGRVFYSEVLPNEDGITYDLRAMFYLPASQKELVDNINLGVIDEVSVGVKSQKMLCSACGFDYLGEDADFGNFWDQTCENGHTIGVDGTHVMMLGLDSWMELSLVSRGASSRAKIAPSARQRLSRETYQRIAASGVQPEAVVLFANQKGWEEMTDLTPVLAKLDALAAASVKADELTVKLSEIEATKVEIEAKLAEVEAQKAETDAKLSEVEAKLAEAETKLAAAEEAKVEAEAKLAARLSVGDLPPGGLSASTERDLTKAEKPTPHSAFRLKR